MICARDLRVSYDGRAVLDGVSFDAADGETVAIMGANGSGKSTLLRVLAGLREPDSGTVEADGVVGFAPEDPRAGLFAGTVANEVAFFPRNRGLDADREAEWAMEQLAVDDLRDRNPLTLSFGQQRRVSIASVLSGAPAALALDEPTAGLDRSGERQLGALLAEIEATVVLSTHAADFAYEMADRVAVLADGDIRRSGPPRRVLADLALLEASGIRPPGIVTWARRRGLDHPPADLDDAVSIAQEAR